MGEQARDSKKKKKNCFIFFYSVRKSLTFKKKKRHSIYVKCNQYALGPLTELEM